MQLRKPRGRRGGHRVARIPVAVITTVGASFTSTIRLHWASNTTSSTIRIYATSAPFFGRPGHTYYFGVEAFSPKGLGSGVPVGNGSTSTTIAADAPRVAPFVGLYTVDGSGTLHPGSSAPLACTGSWPGW